MGQIAVVGMSVLAFAAVVHANPIIMRYSPFGDDGGRTEDYTWLALLLGIGLEYVVFRLFTHKAVGGVARSVGLFLGVHIFTIPLTQIVYLVCRVLLHRSREQTYSYWDANSMISIAIGVLTETVPISLEAAWYHSRISRTCPSFGWKQAWTTSLVSNGASYLAALVFFALSAVSHTPQ